jgi:hypothetical protein
VAPSVRTECHVSLSASVQGRLGTREEALGQIGVIVPPSNFSGFSLFWLQLILVLLFWLRLFLLKRSLLTKGGQADDPLIIDPQEPWSSIS